MIKSQINSLTLLALLIVCISCNDTDTEKTTDQPASDSSVKKGSYAYDAAFLRKNTKSVIELTGDEGKSKILLSSDYQGRVMTSTATGDSGISYGWINYDLISSGTKKAQFNPVGGEERIWLGPEGGQYSIYFKAKDSFNISKWQVPPIIDTVSYDVSSSSNSEAVFTKKTSVTNYSGTVFDISIERKIRMLNKNEISQKLGISLATGISSVAFETHNQLKNEGSSDWKKEKGLLSIWLLGMFTPSDKTVVVIPFKPVKNARSLITENYFGSIPPERLVVKDSVLFFTCDGKYRSKIGLSPVIAKPIAGSFDFEKNVLTVISFEVKENGRYVNSKWEIQKEPYKGDVVNSYNDGPLAEGGQLGPFYELESSSAAQELKKGEVQEYRQSTYHFQGDYSSLRELAKKLLDVDLDELKK